MNDDSNTATIDLFARYAGLIAAMGKMHKELAQDVDAVARAYRILREEKGPGYMRDLPALEYARVIAHGEYLAAKSRDLRRIIASAEADDAAKEKARAELAEIAATVKGYQRASHMRETGNAETADFRPAAQLFSEAMRATAAALMVWAL